MTWERAGHIATVVATVGATVVAAAALWFGSEQFNETQKLAEKNLRLQAEALTNERDTKAIELFVRFNELNKELANRRSPARKDAAFWHQNMMLTLTESVFRLTEGDTGWRATVVWMLETQRPYLQATPQACDTFSTSFQELMRKVVPALQCSRS